MSKLLISSLLISIGSIIGAILRIQIIDRFNGSNRGVFSVNMIATFFLGYIIGMQRLIENFSQDDFLILAFKIGFLGSLSTFSMFAFEVFKKIDNKQFLEAILISFVSITSGILIASFGYKLAYV